MAGIVFNIQKFSIHDGPGIRTTVFLKGCPLRCEWCANPESQAMRIQVLYNQDLCLHCQKCVEICPKKCITHDKFIHIDHQICDGCLKCVENCPSHALMQEGEYKEVSEVMQVIKQDKDFYEESGGGVTISGGEGLLQKDFILALLPELKKEKIHVAVETTGYLPQDQFQLLAPMFDLLLFDMKHYQENMHKKHTHVSNQLILNNLSWAIEQNLPILIRIPVIPNFNNSIQDALGFVSLLKKLNITQVQLLPFHQMGEKKYQLLDKPYLYQDVKALYPEDLNEYRQVFLDHHIHCFF